MIDAEKHFMATTRPSDKPAYNPKTFNFLKRLQEVGVFFQKRSPQHQTMRRLARRLNKAGISYAILGGMAVNAHGAERTTRDIDILLTPDGLQAFRDKLVGEAYEQ